MPRRMCIELVLEGERGFLDIIYESTMPENRRNVPENIEIRIERPNKSLSYVFCSKLENSGSILILKNTVQDLLTHIGLVEKTVESLSTYKH